MVNPAPRSNNDRSSGAIRGQAVLAALSTIPKISLISVVGPAVLLVLGYLLWINYGAKHLNTSLYGLRAENITLTPQPDWIQSSILDEVYQESDLSRLSVLDHNMSSALYDAFRIHPWVRKVFNVKKLSGMQVRVLVEYREPLAMVYCEPLKSGTEQGPSGKGSTEKPVSTVKHNPANQEQTSVKFLPVDADGVLLPTKDFQSDHILKFMLIYAQSAVPIGNVGSEYGDARIKEALLLCRILKNDRERLGIERVYVYPDANSQGPSRWTLELTTRTKKIHWGHPPGLEAPGEPGFPAKLRKLGEFLLTPKPNETSLNEIDLVVSAKPMLGKMLTQ